MIDIEAKQHELSQDIDDMTGPEIQQWLRQFAAEVTEDCASQLAAKDELISEARAQRDWLIAECERIGVKVNVRIGADIREAYALVNRAEAELLRVSGERDHEKNRADYNAESAGNNLLRIKELERQVAELRGVQSEKLLERTAQLTAHRVCCGTEHDPINGKLHGYCVVCGVPWPCEIALVPEVGG